MSINNFGTVQGLFISTKNKTRETINFIEIEEEGIVGDKFYAKGLERSILIASIDSYMLAKENNIDVAHGSLGENILLDINPYNLNSGTKIQVGEAIVEITQNCTICNSLAKVDPNLPTVLKSDRGIFAKTYKAGKIKNGDEVRVL